MLILWRKAQKGGIQTFHLPELFNVSLYLIRETVKLQTFEKMDYQLINNETDKQYEFHIDGFVPQIEYKISGNKIYLTHTEVPKELGGSGIASSLVNDVLEDIQQKGLKLIPLCPFVVKYIRRHPEWKSLVFKE